MFGIHVLVLIMVCHVQTLVLSKNAKNYAFHDSDNVDIESDFLSSDDEGY